MILEELNESKYGTGEDYTKRRARQDKLKPAKEFKPHDGSNLPSSFEKLQIDMAIGYLKNNPDIVDRPIAGFIYDYIEANEPDLLPRVIKKD